MPPEAEREAPWKQAPDVTKVEGCTVLYPPKSTKHSAAHFARDTSLARNAHYAPT